VGFNGMSRMRVVGVLGITAVLVGFLLVLCAVLAGQPTHSARGADRVLRDGGVEADAFGGHSIQIRGFDVRMVFVPQHLGVVLVREDEQDVWFHDADPFRWRASICVSMRS
ncbi:MAG: hypothetical protein R6V16_02515, partial [Bacteroidales bacterium]